MCSHQLMRHLTRGGIVIDFNDEHPENAEYPIDVTNVGIIIEGLLQP